MENFKLGFVTLQNYISSFANITSPALAKTHISINSKIYYKSLTFLCYICVIHKIAIFLKNRDPSESCYNGRTFDPTVTKLFLNLF